MSPVATGPWPLTDAAGLLAAATVAVKAWHVRGGTQIHNYAKLSSVKLNPITTAGVYALPTTNEAIFTPVGGSSSAVLYPNQVSLVATLRTAVSRGPAHAGRFYMPLPCVQVGTDGLIAVTDRDYVETSANLLLTDLNALSPSYKVAVHSRKDGAPAQRLVTAIEVGRVLDTQRRRRRSLLESY